MSQKIFWFDCETTGLDPAVNSIIQLAGIIEIDGQVVETIDLKMRHVEDDSLVDQKAIDTHGISLDTIKSYLAPAEAKRQLDNIFGKYVNKYDSQDKFNVAGKNLNFDLQFLLSFYNRQNDKYLFSYLNSRKQLDIQAIIGYCRFVGYINTFDSKLETIANYLNVKIEAHDALSDIVATRDIFYAIKKRLAWNN